MTQKKNKVKPDAGETKVLITKHIIVDGIEYRIEHKQANVTIWCGSYELENCVIWLYAKPDHIDYIGNFFINKENVKEDIKVIQ